MYPLLVGQVDYMRCCVPSTCRTSWLHEVLCTLCLSYKLTTWGAPSDVTVETEVPRTCWRGTIVIPAQRPLAMNKGLKVLNFVALHLQWWRFIMNEISSSRTDVKQYSINQLSCHFEHSFVLIVKSLPWSWKVVQLLVERKSKWLIIAQILRDSKRIWYL